MSLGKNSLVAAYQGKGQLKSRPSGIRVVTIIIIIRLDDEVKEVQLLGAPLSSETALQPCLKARTKELEESLSKLALIARQDALLILRSSLGTPKMIHTLRCHPSNKLPELETYDTNLRRGLEQ